ncbi:MAG: putative MATE family efflux protein [Oleiphilaceae bacterium]|jgi:putative MATE family efflux protein
MIGGILSIMSMNIVDTFYIAQLGTEPLAAMSFTMPVISVLLSLAFGIGIGASSVISRAIGSKQHILVQAYTSNALIIALVIAVFFAVAGYIWMDELFTQLGAPLYLMPSIHEFMDIWFLGSFVVVIPMVGNSAIRAAGNTKLPSLVMLSISIVNLILDPILIFGLLGFPELGLRGAAIATVVSYAFALIIGLYLLIYKFNFINIHACYSRFFESWRAILRIAIPATGTNLIAPLSVAITTWFVAKHSPEAVAGFGVASRIESLFLVMIMGLSSIMGPFVGQNWGAKNYQRIFSAVDISLKFTLYWGVITATILWLFADNLTGLFSDDPLVIHSASHYLMILPFSYLFLGFIMVVSSAANGMGNPIPSLVMSFLRLVGLYLPFIFILLEFMDISGIYLAAALANIFVGLGAFAWYKKVKRNYLKDNVHNISNTSN